MKVKNDKNTISDMNESIMINTGVVCDLGVEKVSPGMGSDFITHIFSSYHRLVNFIFFSDHFGFDSQNDLSR
jgi:hypothetical protein